MSKEGKEILIFVLVVFFIYFSMTYLTNKVFFLCRVQQTSMEETLLPNEVLIGKRGTLEAKDIKRGDIVVFWGTVGEQKTFLIKRVIGLPGEHLTIKDKKVYINNSETPLNEPYAIKDMDGRKFNFENLDIPLDSVFLMGDNRPISLDSRVFGPVKINEILGKVFFRVYPINKFGGIK